jgi:hypothetical protein
MESVDFHGEVLLASYGRPQLLEGDGPDGPMSVGAEEKQNKATLEVSP